jgi:hypothetical protein
VAPLAETLVDEWLNPKGFLTVRALRDSVNEMVVLAFRLQPSAGTEPGTYIEKMLDRILLRESKSAPKTDSSRGSRRAISPLEQPPSSTAGSFSGEPYVFPFYALKSCW